MYTPPSFSYRCEGMKVRQRVVQTLFQLHLACLLIAAGFGVGCVNPGDGSFLESGQAATAEWTVLAPQNMMVLRGSIGANQSVQGLSTYDLRGTKTDKSASVDFSSHAVATVDYAIDEVPIEGLALRVNYRGSRASS